MSNNRYTGVLPSDYRHFFLPYQCGEAVNIWLTGDAEGAGQYLLSVFFNEGEDQDDPYWEPAEPAELEAILKAWVEI